MNNEIGKGDWEFDNDALRSIVMGRYEKENC
jgi:hypothetical protein